MHTNKTLKLQLQQIDKAGLDPATDIDQLAAQMLDHIGVTDSELRDDLIYALLHGWIMEGRFTCAQLRQVLATCLDEKHLFYNVGDANTDSVFTRSFSILLIAPILSTHRRQPFLSKAEVQDIAAQIITYCHAERDDRGYVRGKGWAHAIAHAADLLDELVLCPEVDLAQLREILRVVQAKINISAVYICGEADRLANILDSLMQRAILTDDEIIEWIQSFVPLLAVDDPLPEGFYRFMNIQTFLRTIHFHLARHEIPHTTLCRSIVDVLEEIENG